VPHTGRTLSHLDFLFLHMEQDAGILFLRFSVCCDVDSLLSASLPSSLPLDCAGTLSLLFGVVSVDGDVLCD